MPAEERDPLLHATLEVGGHHFPGLWATLLPEEFAWLIPPRERRATCAECYEVAIGEYHPATACCTYLPQLSNYTVGLALMDPDARDVIRPQIALYGLPPQLAGSPARYRWSITTYHHDRFGKDPEGICPFLDRDAPQCRIYPYRNSVCSTFFCVHDHGNAGAEFWERLQQLAAHLEVALGQWAMDQLGFGHDFYLARLDALADHVEACTDPETGGWSAFAREQLWGEYLGREEEFYLRCAEQVIEHRDELFERASETPVRHAMAFERAVRAWMPAEVRGDIPPLPEGEGASEPIPSLWYKVQLAQRNLWRLPFGEAAVRFSADAMLAPNRRDDLVSQVDGDRDFVVVLRKIRWFVTAAEAAALRRFDEPQVFGEALLEDPAIAALPNPREFLAMMLRRAILVPVA